MICKHCSEILCDGAKKCRYCGEYQSWFRFALSGLDIKGMAALVPIAALVWAFVNDRITPDRTDLGFQLVECSLKEVKILATNAGNRGGVIKVATHRVSSEVLRFKSLTDEQRVIKGDDPKVVTLVVDADTTRRNLVSKEEAKTPNCAVKINIVFTQDDAEDGNKDLTCTCPAV